METLELQALLREKHGSDNPLFQEDLYLTAIKAALGSPCQKMGFGVPIVHKGKLVSVTTNKPLDVMKHVCEPTCIRFEIASRTESMLGACNHAEEWALDKIRRLGLDPQECKLYVAGVRKDGTPWIKKEPTFSCIRCANQLYRAHIGAVLVPFIDHWAEISAEELMMHALPYATQQKTT